MLQNKVSQIRFFERIFTHVMRELRDRGMFCSALRGWRDECYEIRNRFQDPALFSLERAASPLLGVRKYGIQINGYVRHSGLGLCLWLQKRSVLKPTWPGMMDNFVGGGVTEAWVNILPQKIRGNAH